MSFTMKMQSFRTLPLHGLIPRSILSHSFPLPLCHRSFFSLSRPSCRILPSSFSITSTSSSSSSLSPFSFSPLFVSLRTLYIQAQSTPNPNAMKFLPGRPILSPPSSSSSASASAPSSSSTPSPSPSFSPSTVEFRNASECKKKSPLAHSLFSIEGVNGVLLGPDFVSVNVVDGSDWALVKPAIYAALQDFFASNQPALLAQEGEGEGGEGKGEEGMGSGEDTRILPTDSEVVAMIKELIETRIRPSVQEDGGDILYKGFEEAKGTVYVQMQGSCVGCSSSQITLKNGIENMLKHYVPEVKSVEEVKDELAQLGEEELAKLEKKLAHTH